MQQLNNNQDYKRIAKDCQVVLSVLTKQMEKLLQDLRETLIKNNTVKLKLTDQQLALLAVFLTKEGKRMAIIINKQPNKISTLYNQIRALQKVCLVDADWHHITGEISDQEHQGIVSTSLSDAFHNLFYKNRRIQNILLPAALTTTLIPDPVAYEGSIVQIITGEQYTVSRLIERLVDIGYVRHHKTVEPGCLRVRGEQIDIAHPVLPGYYTITMYGQAIESIIHHVANRTSTVPRLLIPPLRFPKQTTVWHTILKDYTIIRSSHETATTGKQTIIYDALLPHIAFPYNEEHRDTMLPKHKVLCVLYKNLDRVRLQNRAQQAQQTYLCHNPQCAQIPLCLTSPTHIVISEETLCAHSTAVNPLKYEEGLALIQELHEGKPAVHIDHGVGIFEGLHQRTINGSEHEYLVLRYADGDTLSVPVEFAHKISSYIGTDTPTIHRLGENMWHKTKRRAKHNAQLLAHELLKIAGERAQKTRTPYSIESDTEQLLIHSFLYELTPDQTQAWKKVCSDLASNNPMDRLIVGDVGFGKTEIAIRAIAHVVENKKQVALLAPTTLLVQQHYDTLVDRLPHLMKKIAMLSRFTSTREQGKIRQRMTDGSLAVVVGTHALLSPKNTWSTLGLVIIDEEQRFGVQHKEHFKKIRGSADILSLSATPIPRTLYMALSGLRSLSIIATPPAGRREVLTKVLADNDRTITQAIHTELKRNGQAYFVAPKIAQLHVLHARTKRLVPEAKLGIIHAQLDDYKLAHIMQQFDTGKIDVLLSSTIIENGLDLPNVNTIIVYDAASFGLADLYQLRGRIGRRSQQGYAYFLYRQTNLSSIQRQRLAAVTEASRLGSGWELAQRDLELRGAGNVFGAEQSGSIQEVGLQLYSDLVRQEIARQQGSAVPNIECEVRLPISALIPRHYMDDLQERTQWYQRLSRATSLTDLQRQVERITRTFGPPPPETHNLILIQQLQLIAASCGIEKINYHTITPPHNIPRERLEIHAKNIPQLVVKVGHLGTWTIRNETLSLDVKKITPELIHKLLAACHTRQTIQNKTIEKKLL